MIEWENTYGGSGHDYFESVIQASDGGYVAAGDTSSAGAGENDGWLVKFNSMGGIVWNNTFGGSKEDSFDSVFQTMDDGYIVAGKIESAATGDDGWLIKTYPNGSMEWNNTFGGSDDDRFNSVVQTSDGGYIVAGKIESAGAGNSDGWIVKTFANGSVDWNRTYGGSEYDLFNSIIQTSDGNYIAAGRTSSAGAGWSDGWILKLNSNGDITWNKTYGGSDSDQFQSIIQDSDGGYMAAGYYRSIGPGYGYGWLIKVSNVTGVEVLNKTYGGSHYDEFWSVVQISNDDYMIAGRIESTGSGGNDGWLVETDNNFILNWIYGGPNNEALYSVAQTSDGGFIAAGNTYSTGVGIPDGWLVKLSAPPQTTTTTTITTTTTTTTTTCPTFPVCPTCTVTVDPCDCVAQGYDPLCTYWLLPGCNQPAPSWFNPQASPTTTTATTTAVDTTTATITTTTSTTTTTTTGTMNTTAATTESPTPAPTSATATTTTPASGVLIAMLCGFFVIALFRIRKSK